MDGFDGVGFAQVGAVARNQRSGGCLSSFAPDLRRAPQSPLPLHSKVL
jgi:hypothetical protein